jgi:hypothetical protein
MSHLCDNQKITIANFAKKFDKLISTGKENEIENIITKYNTAHHVSPPGSHILSDFFFIWIGCIKPEALEYIDVWKETVGKAGSITIYYDSQFMLFNFYTDKFKLLYTVTDETPIEKIIELQDHFKSIIDDYVGYGCSFDEAFILATKKISPSESLNLERELTLAREYVFRLSINYSMIDIRDNLDVFFDCFFYDIYYLELTLRANAAAAADILRLLILHKQGGVYIDVDTLPSLISIYGPLSSLANYNIQNIVRSEYFIKRRRELKNLDIDKDLNILEYEQYLNAMHAEILLHIKNRSSQINNTSLPFPKIIVQENLITLAALETQYEYNNNILAATKNSKLVMIILREIRRRYKYIFKNGFDVKPAGGAPNYHYLYRLSNYRYDAMNTKDNVTLFLTGPILILEVMLGVAYEILSLDKSISSLALSYALRLNCISVACGEHTCYTPEHMKSSWMKATLG